jgi:hypothetical protein
MAFRHTAKLSRSRGEELALRNYKGEIISYDISYFHFFTVFEEEITRNHDEILNRFMAYALDR